MEPDDDPEAKRRRRSVARIVTPEEHAKETDLSATTVEDRWNMMWELTLQAWTFMEAPVEPRLQRHVERVIRN